MEKAKDYLVRHGWKPGKGLGKNEQGRAIHLRVSKKNDHRGVGQNAKDQYTPWWEKMYNSTAQALTERIASTSPHPDEHGVSPSPSTTPDTKEKKSKKSKKSEDGEPATKKRRVDDDDDSDSSDSDSSSSSDSEEERELAERLAKPIDDVILRRPKAVRLYGTAFAPRFVRGETLVATMPEKGTSPAAEDKSEAPERPPSAQSPAQAQGFVPMPGMHGDDSSDSSSDSDSDDEDSGRPISTSDATFEKLGGSRCKKYSSEAKLRRLAAQEAAWKRKKLASTTTPSPEPA